MHRRVFYSLQARCILQDPLYGAAMRGDRWEFGDMDVYLTDKQAETGFGIVSGERPRVIRNGAVRQSPRSPQ